MKGKTYVVFVGRVPGIYDNWEDAKAQVHRFSDNVYKSFNSRDEAIRAFNNFKNTAQNDPGECNCSSAGSSTTTNTRESYNTQILHGIQDELARENQEHALRVDAII